MNKYNNLFLILFLVANILLASNIKRISPEKYLTVKPGDYIEFSVHITDSKGLTYTEWSVNDIVQKKNIATGTSKYDSWTYEFFSTGKKTISVKAFNIRGEISVCNWNITVEDRSSNIVRENQNQQKRDFEYDNYSSSKKNRNSEGYVNDKLYEIDREIEKAESGKSTGIWMLAGGVAAQVLGWVLYDPISAYNWDGDFSRDESENTISWVLIGAGSIVAVWGAYKWWANAQEAAALKSKRYDISFAPAVIQNPNNKIAFGFNMRISL